MGNDLKQYFVFSLFFLFLSLIPPSNAFSVFGVCLWDCKINTQAITTIDYDGINFTKDTTDGFYQNDKYIKFPKDSIYINSTLNGRLKFDIDFTKCGRKAGYWECKLSLKGVEQIDTKRFSIGSKTMEFPYLKIDSQCSDIQGVEVISTVCNKSVDRLNITFNKNELILESSMDYIDPFLYNDTSSLHSCYDLNSPASHYPADYNLTVEGNTFYNSSDNPISELGSYHFDGNQDWMANETLTNALVNGDFTIGAWIKIDGTTAFTRIITHYLVGGDNYVQLVSNSNSIIVIGHYASMSETGWQTGANVLPDGQWHNVLIRVTASTSKKTHIYVDGVNKSVSTTSGFGIGTKNGLTLGIRNDYTASDFKGNLGQVVMWNKILNSSEMTEYFNSGNGRTCDYYYNVTGAGGEPPAGDTCDYSSGNFVIDCDESCTVDASYSIGGNDVIIKGSGKININEDITNCGNYKIYGTDSSNKCEVKINNARFCT